MALMDVFVLPSWREGMPRSAIEAAASGLPLVLTDIRGCREVVRDGVEGFLVPVRDPRPPGRRDRAPARGSVAPVADGRGGPGASRGRCSTSGGSPRAVVDATRSLLGAAEASMLDAGGGRGCDRPAPGDAAAMARLHREAMPTAFLPTLGGAFLRRLYGAMIADPAAWSRSSRRIAAGSSASRPPPRRSVRSIGGSLVGAGSAAGLAAAPHLLRPSVLRRAIETARYPAGMDGLPDAELLSIAVDGPAALERRRERSGRGDRPRAGGDGRVRVQGRRRGRQRRGQPVLRATRVPAGRGGRRAPGRPEQRVGDDVSFLIAAAIGVVLTPVLARIGSRLGLSIARAS